MKDYIPTALITGASSGIGYELTLLFARDRYNLVLVARNEAQLRQMAEKLSGEYHISVKALGADLADPDAAIDIFNELEDEGICVNVLVNNAGFGDFGQFRELDLKKQLDMIQVNVTSLTYLTKLFLNQLPQGREGKILNVSSVAAFQPGPLMAVYYATKAFVLSFSEALAEELKNSNVSVTVLCPGTTATDFERNANLEESRLFRLNIVSDAHEVAIAAYKGLKERQKLVIPGLHNKLLTFSVRLVPRSVVPRIVRKIQERKK